VIQRGDLVSFDTDLVGRHGYSVDLSRSWLTEGAAATDEQRTLHALAHAQIHHNIDVLKPGRTFREIADAAYRLPERFVPRMNRAIAHGIGLCNEYPLVVNSEYFAGAYDGVLAEGMVLCVESYVGEPGGPRRREARGAGADHGPRRGQAIRFPVRRRAALRCPDGHVTHRTESDHTTSFPTTGAEHRPARRPAGTCTRRRSSTSS
jgi:hypothetical protein